MSHEYSDIAKMRASTELPVDGAQRPELAPGGVHHAIGTVAIAEADSAVPKYYIQDTLDASLDPPLFPASKVSESSRQQQNNNSAIKRRHPEDMEQEI